MALNDVVAQHIMGELDTLTKLIDEQSVRIGGAKDAINQAAERIKKNSEEAVAHAEESARQVQLESFAKFQVQLSTAVSQTLSSVATAVAVKSAVKWVLAGVVLAGVLGAAGYVEGKNAGKADGYAQARNEVVAADWANTPEGKLAFQLAEAGSITALANCDKNRGWQLEKNLCVPLTTKDGTYGWKIKK